MEKVKDMKTWPGINIISLTKSFALKTLVFAVIWGFGYMNWSFVWLIFPIGFIVLAGEKKKAGYLRRLTAQATALSKDRIIVESRIDELPSWVFFPDYSRVDWLNEIVLKMWPNLSVSDKFKNKVQKLLTKPLLKIKRKIPGMGNEIYFEKIVLGKIPPKVLGVKVHHKNTSRDEILLDLDLMYAGDCDISFYLGNLKAGIKDFQLRGTLRLVLKSLLPVEPFVGAYQVFFFNRPIFDFELVGVAEILDLPGIDDAFRRKFGKKLAKKFVLPNKFTKYLSQKAIDKKFQIPEPEGVLRMHVIEAENLEAKDNTLFSKGTSDPYVFITVGAQEFQSKTMESSVNPKWDFWCEALIDSSINQKIEITVWDEDPRIFGLHNDDFLGRTTVEVSRVKRKELTDVWLPLESVKHGKIHICFSWHQLSFDPTDIRPAFKDVQDLGPLSNAVLILFVESAKNLPYSYEDEEPDVYLEAILGNKIVKTKKRSETRNPVWEQGFTFLVPNFQTSVLYIKVNDDKTSTVIGTFTCQASSLLDEENFERKLQPYTLKSNYSEGEISISMSLKIVRQEKNNVNQVIQKVNKTRPEEKLTKDGSDSSSSSAADESIALLNSQFKDHTENSSTEAETSGKDILESDSDVDEKSLSLTSSNGLDAAGSLGKIQLTISYSDPRQKLTIIVHKVEDLPTSENHSFRNLDFYVKLYLLPNKSKESKQKTSMSKINESLVFDEKFEYVMSRVEMSSQSLEISLRAKKRWLRKGTRLIGQAVIKLSDLKLSESSTEWYDLHSEPKH